MAEPNSSSSSAEKEKPKKSRKRKGTPLEVVKTPTLELQEPSELKKKKRRPWRDRVRKKAAKEAKRKARELHAGESASKPVEKPEQKVAKKKKAKRDRRVADTVSADASSRLESARFRYVNEQLYTMRSDEAVQLFDEDPTAFAAYHKGYKFQVKKWPSNPVNEVIRWLRKVANPETVIVDMGCGDAKIAEALEGRAVVHSFDLIALNQRVVQCDMANVPLADDSADVVVFCLSLMCTNLVDFVREAARILKIKGIMKIMEVRSRFEDDSRKFVKAVESLGFSSNRKAFVCTPYFLSFEFVRIAKVSRSPPEDFTLKPCLYKKR